ncbi:methyltransferase domain-containing protein [Flavobacterium croceum]|uniref:methyltransferase domain-containing protein n=1 Tax=Flavobacterium croceum TaxID=370975 RepID=UPI0024A7BA30|nr:methyltransferase domain-containing protein [Flavobacterium croceum]
MTKLNKEYWESRYKENEVGWDTGAITTPLKEYIDQLENKDTKILIPGAGNGYEFEYLISKGFRNVYVLDIAQQPLENIARRVENAFLKNLIEQDFFEHQEQYDLILEQTFFCALDPKLREKYVEKAHTLLSEHGKLVGLLFQFPLTQSGPPFGGSKEEYVKLFSDFFTIKTLEDCYNSIKPRMNNEVFINFIKK